jgi:hypothetical protein
MTIVVRVSAAIATTTTCLVKVKARVMSHHHSHYHNPARLAVHLLMLARFTGEGEDLKPEAFDRWYAAVRLYQNLTGVSANGAGSGNHWILYTTGRALEAANHSLQSRGDEISRDQLVSNLRKLSQTSRQQDYIYE